jgi:hypothetical protein
LPDASCRSRGAPLYSHPRSWLQTLHRDGRDGSDGSDKLGVAVTVEKVTDYAALAGYGIASTPGIVIVGKVVHAGGLPKSEDLARWLAAQDGTDA